MIRNAEDARRVSAARKHKSGGHRGRMRGAISNAPRCPCGCGLTLYKAIMRHPARAEAAWMAQTT